LYPYKAEEVGKSDEPSEVQWQMQMPVVEKPQMEKILDKQVGKKTRRKEYFQYLVKWNDHLVEDVSWENEAEILKHG
jgi:hypothetical protein